MSDVSITIIGAGVIGLAIAEKLSQYYSDIYVIERNSKFGQETSSRNSEVIHAGIYYPKNTLKAKLCVESNPKLYSFCEKYDVEYSKCGKFVVATTKEEVVQLEDVRQKAIANGVNNLVYLTEQEIKEKEPNIKAIKALYSPSTGIINVASFMKKLESLAINNGVDFVYKSELKHIEYSGNEYNLLINDADGNDFSFSSNIVINSAGLEADKVAAMIGIESEYLRIQFCKGEYFRINPPKNRLVKSLIYPVPYPKLVGVGIHATVDISGGLKLGPDVEYLAKNEYNYKVDASKRAKFYESVKAFMPFLDLEDLSPEMVGIRPKIQKDGEEYKDFYIMEESKRGLPKFINLIGMESPGLTASLAIADYVYGLLNK